MQNVFSILYRKGQADTKFHVHHQLCPIENIICMTKNKCNIKWHLVEDKLTLRKSQSFNKEWFEIFYVFKIIK